LADRATSAAANPGGNIHSIPAGAPFLPVLARALVDGRLIEGFRPLGDPFAMARATVYLPTRRAARAFGEAIREASGRRAMLLPEIHALGDADDEEVIFASAGDAEPLPAAVGQTGRRLFLASLVKRFTAAVALGGNEEFRLSAGAGEAAMLAGDLAAVIDQLATEEVEWSQIEAYANRESEGAPWAEWWTLTLKFLAIVGEFWPAHLAGTGLLDPARRRRALLDLRCRQYLERGAPGPVIAAGSTGSIPATARLIKAIASLEQGAVVLPGVDFDIDDSLFDRLADGRACGEDPTLATHPQAGLAQLLYGLGLRPGAIRQLGDVSGELAARGRIVRRAMLPAGDTDAWSRPLADTGQASARLSVIEAHNEREEALGVAIALREALEEKGKTAALVTPDRNLARRVAAELRRFGIDIDDSAGRPLASTRAYDFVDALLAVALGNAGPDSHASLIKHPFLLAVSGPQARKLARYFELAVLRDVLTPPGAGSMADAVRRARERISRSKYASAPLKGMDASRWQELAELGEMLDMGLAPLASLAAPRTPVAVSEFAAALLQAIDYLLPLPSRFHDDAAGGALLELLEEMAAAGDVGLAVEPAEFPSLLRAFAGDITIRETREMHPRLSIWGPLEARLQQVDRIVLGGLNEGVWPDAGRDDPFLNRSMRTALGLSQPERRIGLAAHDFQQLSGHDEVFYTRSARRDGTPTVASRFLQRLATTAGSVCAEAMRERGQRYLQLAAVVDAATAPAQWTQRPNPKPPLELRPKRLSITEVETWIRDPYAIYARHVLALRPLPPLLAQADPLLRGSIYHRVLDLYVRQSGNAAPSLGLLEEIARVVFAEYDLPAEAGASWLPRFLDVGRQFIKWEQRRRPGIAESRTEIRGDMTVGVHGFRLAGRADRIDVMRDGGIAILDYKTGGNPSTKQARTLSPQLALEAAMAQAGAFGLPPGVPVDSLAYVRLRPGGNWKIDDICEGSQAPTPDSLAESALAQLGELITAFADSDQGYISRRAPLLEAQVTGDYDHLARVREWTIGEEADDDAV
jgi:ATP-dependent helicase/nuclease subunit B